LSVQKSEHPAGIKGDDLGAADERSKAIECRSEREQLVGAFGIDAKATSEPTGKSALGVDEGGEDGSGSAGNEAAGRDLNERSARRVLAGGLDRERDQPLVGVVGDQTPSFVREQGALESRVVERSLEKTQPCRPTAAEEAMQQRLVGEPATGSAQNLSGPSSDRIHDDEIVGCRV
jgi:hypothetical protein